MSVIKAIFSKTAYCYEDAFDAKDCTSDAMQAAIQEWFDLYYETVHTKDEDPCQRIAYTVVNKLVKTMFGEYTASYADDFAEGVLNALERRRKLAMQMALIGGECLMKPIPTATGWLWTVINRGNVLVFGRDLDGHPTDIGTAEYTTANKSYYTLLERRTLDGNGFLTISNRLYRSSLRGSLGMRVPVSELPKYAALPEQYTFSEPINTLGVVYMKTPVANCVDGSEDGVSVYAAATGLIHNINRNEAQINAEFENGESKVFVSADLLKKDKNGSRSFRDRIFTALDDDPKAVGVTIFSPALRDESFLNRKREYLRNVETVIGIKRGLLSEVEAQERTATEVTDSKGDYALTLTDLQGMWETALKDAVQLCGVLGRLYHIPGAHEVDAEKAVLISWGDGVLYNRDKVNEEMLAQVQAGLLTPERYLGWYYEMPCDTPEERKKIKEAYMPKMENLTDGKDDDG